MAAAQTAGTPETDKPKKAKPKDVYEQLGVTRRFSLPLIGTPINQPCWLTADHSASVAVGIHVSYGRVSGRVTRIEFCNDSWFLITVHNMDKPVGYFLMTAGGYSSCARASARVVAPLQSHVL